MYHNTLVCGAFWGVWVKFKNFLGPTYVDNYLSFWKYSPIFFVFNSATFGASFALFWALGAILLSLWSYYWGQSQVQKKFFWSLLREGLKKGGTG